MSVSGKCFDYDYNQCRITSARKSNVVIHVQDQIKNLWSQQIDSFGSKKDGLHRKMVLPGLSYKEKVSITYFLQILFI